MPKLPSRLLFPCTKNKDTGRACVCRSVTKTQEVSYQAPLVQGSGPGVMAQKQFQTLPQYQNLQMFKPCGNLNFVCSLHIPQPEHSESPLKDTECHTQCKRWVGRLY